MKEKVYHVADSAFYTAENIQSVREHTFWITRVPATVSEVTDLENTDLEFTLGNDERYSWFECPADYAGIKQKWVVYHSELMQERQEKTFDTHLEKDLGKARKSVKKDLFSGVCLRTRCTRSCRTVAEEESTIPVPRL